MNLNDVLILNNEKKRINIERSNLNTLDWDYGYSNHRNWDKLDNLKKELRSKKKELKKDLVFRKKQTKHTIKFFKEVILNLKKNAKTNKNLYSSYSLNSNLDNNNYCFKPNYLNFDLLYSLCYENNILFKIELLNDDSISMNFEINLKHKLNDYQLLSIKNENNINMYCYFNKVLNEEKVIKIKK